MHRHGYRGRKLGRERDARRALLKTMASNLIESESIVTTLPKAKEVRPYVEKLISKAKKGDLHNRRQVISGVAHVESAHKLVDEVAPLLKNRDSGYLRIVKEGTRRGDNTEMARVEFVDDLESLRKDGTKKASKSDKKSAAPVKASAGQAAKAESAPKKEKK